MSSSILFFLFIPILTSILLAVNFIFAPHNPYEQKNSAFECGFSSFLGQNRIQFHISFYIFAILFMIFDIELILCYPYLVSAYDNGLYGLAILLLFFLALTSGFAYELGKKALSIDSRQMSNSATQQSVTSYNTKFNVSNIVRRKHYSTFHSYVFVSTSALFAYVLEKFKFHIVNELERKLTDFIIRVIKSSFIYKILVYIAYVLHEFIYSNGNLWQSFHIYKGHILKICLLCLFGLNFFGIIDFVSIFWYISNKLIRIMFDISIDLLMYVLPNLIMSELIYSFVGYIFCNTSIKKDMPSIAYSIYNNLLWLLHKHKYVILFAYFVCFLAMYYTDYKLFALITLCATLGLNVSFIALIFIYITYINKNLYKTDPVLYKFLLFSLFIFIVASIILLCLTLTLTYDVLGLYYVYTGNNSGETPGNAGQNGGNDGPGPSGGNGGPSGGGPDGGGPDGGNGGPDGGPDGPTTTTQPITRKYKKSEEQTKWHTQRSRIRREENRTKETSQEREVRKEKDKKREKKVRDNYTPERREARLIKQRETDAKRRAKRRTHNEEQDNRRQTRKIWTT